MSFPPHTPATDDRQAPATDIDDASADPTLIRAFLAMTPEERLARLQAHVDGLWELGLGESPPLR